MHSVSWLLVTLLASSKTWLLHVVLGQRSCELELALLPHVVLDAGLHVLLRGLIDEAHEFDDCMALKGFPVKSRRKLFTV